MAEDDLRAALAESRANWPENLSPSEAKAWIAAHDRMEGLIAPSTPEPRTRQPAAKGSPDFEEQVRLVVEEGRAPW